MVSNPEAVDTLLQSSAEIGFQSHQLCDEARLSLDRHLVPPARTRYWYLWKVLASQIQQVAISYGDGHVYGEGKLYAEPDNGYEISPPANMVSPGRFILASPAGDGVVWCQNTDYWWQDSSHAKLVFRRHPADLAFDATTIYTDGVATDTEYKFWCFYSKWDASDVYYEWAYILGLPNGPATEAYRNLMNRYWDILVEGPSASKLEMLANAVADVPVVETDGEVVQYITATDDKLAITTTNKTYLFHPDSAAIVSVGDTVDEDDQLVDTVQLFEVGPDSLPSASDVPLVTVGQQFTKRETGQLGWLNRNVDVEVETDADGTTVTFELTGEASKVQLFWAGVDQTLLQAAIGTNGTFPAALNPFELLVSLWEGGFFVLKVTTNRCGPDWLGVDWFSYLRSLVPARVAYVVIIETLLADEEGSSMAGASLLMSDETDASDLMEGITVDSESMVMTDLEPIVELP